MSRFSEAFARALADTHVSQIEFSRRSRIIPSQVSKYARGKLGAGRAALETIARELPEAQRAKVIAAWLRDMIPENASGLVSVELPAMRLAESAPAFAADLSPELQSAFVYLIDQSRHREIRDLIVDLARALQGKR